jgi:hypothetical protein
MPEEWARYLERKFGGFVGGGPGLRRCGFSDCLFHLALGWVDSCCHDRQGSHNGRASNLRSTASTTNPDQFFTQSPLLNDRQGGLQSHSGGCRATWPSQKSAAKSSRCPTAQAGFSNLCTRARGRVRGLLQPLQEFEPHLHPMTTAHIRAIVRSLRKIMSRCCSPHEDLGSRFAIGRA